MQVSEDDEFFDAKSFMDSIHSVFSAGSTSGSGVMSPVDSPGSAQITLSRMQSLTASVRQVHGERVGVWDALSGTVCDTAAVFWQLLAGSHIIATLT